MMSLGYRRGRLILTDDEPLPRSSRAAQMDAALQKGGSLTAIAAELGTTVRWLRRHIRDREASGIWRFEPSAGRLVRYKGRKSDGRTQ